MRQLEIVGTREVRWNEVPAPRLQGDGEALVRPLAVAMCDLDAVFLSGAILLLGAPPVAVLASQTIAVALDFFEHANLRLPAPLDRVLRLVMVTPDMHRIHHSRDRREGNANFSTTFSWWDRLFGTYVEHPAAGHEDMAFGVEELAEPKHLRLHWMLAQPFLPGKPPRRL